MLLLYSKYTLMIKKIKHQGNRNPHSLLVGMQNGPSTLENSLMVSYKSQYALSTQSSSQALWYLCKGVENMSTQKLVHRCL